MKEDTSDYLWDRSGAPDPAVERLEEILGRLRHDRPAPPLPSRRTTRSGMSARAVRALAAAAVLALAVAAGWVAWTMSRTGWAVRSVSGRPAVGGQAVRESARLQVGEWLVTDGASRASVAASAIGHVDVYPNSRVQLLESKDREHRLSLERGTIHARIWAPPRFFYVNTPAAVAIDLGCEYTLQVDDSGAGQLRVTQGWVGFESYGREAFVPEGAMCATRPGYGPGTPLFEDAPSGFGEALAVLDFDAANGDRAAALDLVLSRARRRDALTLWHLLARGTRDERARVYDRLAVLAPPPQGLSREAVLSGSRDARARWWDSLGLQTPWWKVLKKKK